MFLSATLPRWRRLRRWPLDVYLGGDTSTNEIARLSQNLFALAKKASGGGGVVYRPSKCLEGLWLLVHGNSSPFVNWRAEEPLSQACKTKSSQYTLTEYLCHQSGESLGQPHLIGSHDTFHLKLNVPA